MTHPIPKRNAMFLLLSFPALALFLAAQPAFAAEDPMKAGLAQIEQDIIVEAQRGDTVKALVDQALPDNADKHLLRWYQTICLTARGFMPDQEAQFRDQFTKVAAVAELKVATGKCKPNVIVLLTDDPDRLIRDMLKDHPRIFTPQKPSQVRKSLAKGDVVRSWHHAILKNATGTDMDLSDGRAGGFVAPMATVGPGRASRLGSATRAELFRAVIILDVRKLGGYGLGAVSAHVGMLALGRFESDLDTSRETILNLFTPASDRQVTEMSDLDRQLLSELYAANAANKLKWQRQEIARKINATQRD